MRLRVAYQFQDFWLERGVTGQRFPVSVTFLAIPRPEEAARLSKDRRKRGYVPNANGRVEHDFGAPRRHHVIPIRVAPAASVKTLFVETLEDVQPFGRAES